MSYPTLNQLTRAEELFNDGNLEEALEVLNDERHFEGLSLQQRSYSQFLKGLIFFYLNKGEDLISLGQGIHKEGQKYKNNLQSCDGLIFIITGLAIAGKFDEANNFFDEIKSLIKSLSNVSKEIITQRKARLSVVKAFVELRGSKVELVEESLLWILKSQEKFDESYEIIWANLIMASYVTRVEYDLDLCKKHIKKALSLAKKGKFNHYWIALCQLYFGVYYASIGEMDKSLKYNISALELFKKMKSSFNVSIILSNMGDMYSEMGEYELAVEHLEKSKNILEQLPQGFVSMKGIIESLIDLAVEHGDNARAQEYFHHLEENYYHKNGDRTKIGYKFSKALILKTSSRIRDKAKAEELLKEIVETKTILFDVIIKAHIHLCDILLTEYSIENNIEVLNELNYYIARLLDIAEKQQSYLVFCETFILRAKLALVNFNMKTARRFLTQAQKIAESNGIKRLAMKISYEHDELLKQTKMWENLKASEVSLSERLELAGLNKQMEKMFKKRIFKIPEVSEEQPVLLLIVSEGGVPFFSHSFEQEQSFESHLFGGFLSTIDYFINEMFSEGLDRAVFGEHTLLMKSIPPFFISYIFKGDSYYALQKLEYFEDKLHKEGEVWQNMLNSFQQNTTIKLKDEPLLGSLIKETFRSKNVVFSE